jgi:hypothetical protein
MNNFPLTLWHGTSAHLLPTIKEHGLGGRNIMQDWRVMAFLQWALHFVDVDDTDFAHPDYIPLLSVKAAAKGGAAGMNFEYGDVYVAGGFDKAADYSLNAPELMSLARTVLDISDRRGVGEVRDGLADYPEIRDFLALEPSPVVLKLPPVPKDMVKSERGGDVPFLNRLGDERANIRLAQLGFRLTSVVPFNEIEVIDTKDHQRVYVF